MAAYSESSLLVLLGIVLAGLFVLWFAYKALKASGRSPRYAAGFALAGGALLLFAAAAQAIFGGNYYGRIDMAESFWLQTFTYILAGPLIIWRFGKFFRLFMAPLFAYGLGFVAAGGILFLASLLILEQTSSGGRGWGGLIFLFLFFADAALAGIGGLLIVIGIIKWLFRASAVNGPMEKSALDAQYAGDDRHENRWKTEYAASEPHAAAPEAKEYPDPRNEEPAAAAAAQKSGEKGT